VPLFIELEGRFAPTDVAYELTNIVSNETY